VLGSYEDETKSHKWSFSTLSKHLESQGVDLDLLWSRIYDVIIKSLLSIDPVVINNFKRMGFDKAANCFELFGFDILIDSNLK
jgi:tubulin polyglutamylase TTLL5